MPGGGQAERIRVLIAGPGPDADAATVARALRDAGMEVVYTDRQHSAEELVETVVQEDADAVGLSGAHLPLLGSVPALLSGRTADDVVVFGHGVPPGAAPDRSDAVRVFEWGVPDEVLVGWLRSVLLSGRDV
jgi:methylmalonyl-CoA mutase C-terminal domain/subunit